MFGKYKLPENLVQEEIANKYLEPTDVFNLKLVDKRSFAFLKLKPEDRKQIIIEKIIQVTIEAIKGYIQSYQSKLKKQKYDKFWDFDTLTEYEIPKAEREDFVFDLNHHNACSFFDILNDGYVSNDFKFFVINDCILSNKLLDTKLKKCVLDKYKNKNLNWKELLKHANDKLAYSEEQKLTIADAIKRHVCDEHNQNSGQRRYKTYLNGRDSQLIYCTKTLYMLNDKQLFSHKVIPVWLSKIKEYLVDRVSNPDLEKQIEKLQTILQDEEISITLKATLVYGLCFMNRSSITLQFFEELWNNLQKILFDQKSFKELLENMWRVNTAEGHSITMQKLFYDDNKTVEELKSCLLKIENDWNEEQKRWHHEMSREPKMKAIESINTDIGQNRPQDPEPKSDSVCLVM